MVKGTASRVVVCLLTTILLSAIFSTHPSLLFAAGEKVFPASRAELLDSPQREAWQRPAEVVKALSLRKGDQVADIGCGSGYFTFLLAREVAGSPESNGRSGGKVYAVDIQSEMLQIVRRKMLQQRVLNVVTVLSKPDDASLPSSSLDLALLVNVYHEVDHRIPFLKSIYAALKKGGRMVFIDFHRKASFGPPLSERILEETVKNETSQVGLKFVKSLDFLPEQYFLEFEKP